MECTNFGIINKNGGVLLLQCTRDIERKNKKIGTGRDEVRVNSTHEPGIVPNDH